MAMIEFLHSQALLAQIVDSKPASAWDPFTGKTDRPVGDLLNATECAISQIFKFGEFCIKALRIGAIEERFVSAQPMSASKVCAAHRL